LALSLGCAAADYLFKGQTDKAVAMHDGKIFTVDLEFAITKKEFEVDRLYNLIKILT
jgi:hypothetical protein